MRRDDKSIILKFKLQEFIMMPFLMDDDPILFSAASTLKMKLFKVEDQLLAIDEDGEKTLFAKEGEDDVIFTLVSEDPSLQDKCSKMLISMVLTEIKNIMQHTESFDFDLDELRAMMKTRKFLSSIRKYFKNKGQNNG